MIVFVVFCNRYFVGVYIKNLKGKNFDETIEGYEPTVSVVVPMFNEGEGIYRTINSLVALDYPKEKLEVIVVDDCSTDDSYQWARKAAREHNNVLVMRNAENMGKRRSINRAVRRSTSEIIVSVDSDVVVDNHAIKALVKRFVRPQIAAVGGRVSVINKDKNWLTQMQTVKYYFGYEYLKNVETAFNTVMCLSGCLTAYRRTVLLELEPILENRNMLGIPIKYGEDRFLTRQIVKAGYQTTMTLEANSYTVVPEKLSGYFSQQLRWRRSNIVDFLGGIWHIWRVNPFVMVHYLGLFGMMFMYPLVIAHTIVAGNFLALAVFHLGILGIFSTVYKLKTWSLPEDMKVNPMAFLAMVVVMPVTYLLLTPLAMFTLDSGNWETRGKPTPKEEEIEAAELAPAVPTTYTSMQFAHVSNHGRTELPGVAAWTEQSFKRRDTTIGGNNRQL